MEKVDGRILLPTCLLIFFFGSWLIPITDPTETCYTLTAKEMLESGDYFSPRIYGNYWFDKPIFFYWELLAAYSIFGVNEFASRFFPAVFATIGVLLTYFFAGKLYNRTTGLFAAIILATSLEYWYIAHAVITDLTLFCAISSTLMFFYFAYTEKKYSSYYFCYVLSGIAVLTKGPIGFLLPGLIIFLFLLSCDDLKHLLKMHLLKGLTMTLAIVAIWYLPMYLMHGSPFLIDFLGVHNFLRATVSEHPEVNFICFYAAVFIVGFLPWVLPILCTQIKKFWRERRLPVLDIRQKFLLIWAATVFVVFQSFATKYVTYTFPYMMPTAILFALYFVERRKLFYRMAIITVIVFTIGVIPASLICERYSGREAAQIISPLVNENTCVVNYREVYSGSLVFYLGSPVLRLDTAENISRLKPHKMQWTTTNVMPFISFKDLPVDKKIIAVVDCDREKKFFSFVKGDWQLFKEFDEYKIFVRK